MVDVLPSPEMLVVARQSRMLTQTELADRISVSQGQLSKYENGIDFPDEALIGKFARTLRYKPSLFYQRTAVHGLPPFHHRKRSRLGARVLDAIHAELNIRRLHLEILIRSAEIEATQPFPTLQLADFDGDIEDVARTLRELWLLPRGPVRNVTELVENAGVVVIQCDFGTDLIDGLSLRVGTLPPMIFIRSNLPGDRLRFTLMHEVAHLLLHFFGPSSDEDMERQAHAFAAAFLMPSRDISAHLAGLSISKLMTLKQVWGVSMQSILYRASQLHEISPRQADYLWRTVSKAGYRRHEPIEVPVEETRLVSEIVDLHLDELGYDIEDMSNLLHLETNEFVAKYLRASRKARVLDGGRSDKRVETPLRSSPYLRRVK